MHFRQKLAFMALGSILTIAGYLLATLTRDVTAQPETDKATVFDEIVCRKLKMIDENGKTRVEIGANFLTGYMDFKTSDGVKAISISAFGGLKSMTFWNDDKDGLYIGAIRNGGFMHVTNADGQKVVSIGEVSDHGYMAVKHADGKEVVSIGVVSDHGYMSVNRADGETAVFIAHNDADNGGLVSVYGKSMKGSAQLTANEYGGLLNIFSKTDNKARILIGITERGNGSINTWDKNGYRTRP